MGTMFLQLVDASVFLADVRDFSPLESQLAPVELGLALSRFYEHIGAILENHRGRIVKFLGDAVLGVFVGAKGEHRKRLLAAVAEASDARARFLSENVPLRLPLLDYVAVGASGTLLAGEIGTEKLRFYDVLGEPVSYAFRLASLAAARGDGNLIHSSTLDGLSATDHAPVVEVDAVEIIGKKQRVFRIEQPLP